MKVVKFDLAVTKEKFMYVYIRSEPNLYTVGFYAPDGQWHPDSDYDDRNGAADRVAWLNGQRDDKAPDAPEASYARAVVCRHDSKLPGCRSNGH